MPGPIDLPVAVCHVSFHFNMLDEALMRVRITPRYPPLSASVDLPSYDWPKNVAVARGPAGFFSRTDPCDATVSFGQQREGLLPRDEHYGRPYLGWNPIPPYFQPGVRCFRHDHLISTYHSSTTSRLHSGGLLFPNAVSYVNRAPLPEGSGFSQHFSPLVAASCFFSYDPSAPLFRCAHLGCGSLSFSLQQSDKLRLESFAVIYLTSQ